MKINTLLILSAFSLGTTTFTYSQCEINANVFPSQIYCGQSTTLTATGIGAGTVVMSENFNSGFGSGWSGTPGATSFSNPCSSGGTDGTPHAWMDNNTSVPRTLTSTPFNLSGATAGVTICFDLLFAKQGANAPCEGPDESDEGVYFQYSTDGTNWTTIHYFNPNGGNDPQLTNWNNWCFQIPAAAITSNTRFRWHQTADSGAAYDHWGIDNVQIVQNDVNAVVAWGTPSDDYYHSYGVGNPGGQHPTPVSPTETTTYNVQITTGTGEVCTSSVTVTVLDPVYEVTFDTNPDPATVCIGNCVEVTGTAIQVIHPGGITTYENNQTENVSGAGIGSVGASVNVNVQGINANALLSGMITEVCINQFNYFAGGFPSNTTVANFEYKLVAPGGCGEIILIPSGTLQPSTNTGSMQNVCFVVGGATNIGSVSQPYSGSYQPNQPFDNLVGCDPNGTWTLQMSASTFLSIGVGAFTGWSITFDNPPVYGAVSTSWGPTTGVSVPTTGLSNPNNINTQICPSGTGNYVLTVGNGTVGCATQDFPLAITVEPCGGCIPPAIIVNPLSTCSPATVNLANAINPSSPAATLSYHATQTDAQNDVSPISTTVSTTGSYWVRAEDPADPTCFTVREITVSPTSQADASFTLTNFCEGANNAATNIATPGGIFTFTTAPTDGATIDAATGQIYNGVNGATYTVTYTTVGACSASSTQSVSVSGITFTSSSVGENCGNDDGEITLTATSGIAPYSYSINGGTTTQSSGLFTGLSSGSYQIEVEDNSGCTVTGTVVVSVIGGVSIDNTTSVNISCNGLCDGEASVIVSGGTLPYTFEWLDNSGSTIGGNASSITDLCEGDYTLSVYDAGTGASCAVTINFSITEPNELTLSTSSTNESCNSGCDGSINWQIQGGTSPITVSFDGTNTTANNAGSLCSDTYSITVTDINGCAVSEDITITPGSTIDIDSVNIINNGCSTGCNTTIIATSASGVSYTLDSITNTTGIFDSICSGTYILEIENIDGCIASSTLIIPSQETPSAVFGFTPTAPTIFDTEVHFKNYSENSTTYHWEITDITTGYSYSTSEEFFTHLFPSDTGRYQICLIAYNATGCSDTLCREIIIYDDIAVYVPNTFTPDDDEFNQTFRIYANGIDRHDFQFFIFNRWGEVIYESRDFSIGWDGTYKGNPVQSGTYTWKMEIKNKQKDFRKLLTGHVNILR
jgi:gliding motility-associated-like protein